MKQIMIQIEDSAYEQFMGMVALCPQVKVVGTSDEVDVLNNRDQCMKLAIETLRTNKVFRHMYDYTWIMLALNDGVLEEYDGFKSPQAFLDYLYEIGIDGLPSRITLFLANSKTLDSYPNWTFLDVDSASEILRRKNVVKQFMSAYIKAKYGYLNKNLNK